MSTHAEATFTIDGWEEEDVFDADGVRIYRVKVAKTLTGGFEGTARGWMTMAVAPGDSAAYVGFDRLDVTVDGRRGAFVIRHDASMHAGGGDATWDIVPGSGTGELVGIRGSSTVDRRDDGSHTYAIDYDLDQPDPASPDDPSKPVEEWVTGDEPATGPQLSYLETLARDASEEVPAGLTKGEASALIDRLRQQSDRVAGTDSGT